MAGQLHGEKMPGTAYKAAALFMIYLTISLTFVSALSMRADAFMDVKIEGEDQLPSFRRTNDSTSVTVYSDTNLVSIVGSSSTLNLTCQEASGGFVCTYTFPKAVQSPGAYTLNFQQEGGDPPTKTASYLVDGLGPRFTNARFTQIGSSVSATYDLYDTAGPTTAECVGLDQVQLVVNENLYGLDEFSPGVCQGNGILTASVPGVSGPAEVYLKGTDRLGNTGLSEKKTMYLDTLLPALPSNFQLLRNGVDLQQISTDTTSTITATLSFTIQEEHLATVTVDASALTTDARLSAAYTSLTPICRPEGNLYTCQIPNLRISPVDEQLKITITAKDSKGNVATGDAYKVLSIMNTKPHVTYFGRASRCDECFLTSGSNELFMEVNAPGGLLGQELNLQMENGGIYAANNCTDIGGDTWECTAIVQASGNSGNKEAVLIMPSSQDDLGNHVTGVLRQNFTIDNEKPSVIGSPKSDAACPVAGQKLTVTVEAKDDYSPHLYLEANTSAVTDRDTVANRCAVTGDNLFTCTLEIDSFYSVHTEGVVPIILKDEAGNAKRIELPLEVCEADTETVPNFIKKMGPAPDIGRTMALGSNLPMVDKRIASIIPFRVVIPLKLEMIAGARPIQVLSTRCTSPEVVRPTYVMNEFTEAPVLVTNFKYDGVWDNESVDLNCTLDFTIRKGNVVYTTPESEPLNLALPLIGEELGNPGQAVLDKDHGLVDEINKLQGRIESRAKIDSSLGMVCRLAEMLGNINAMMQAIKSVLYGIAMLFVGWLEPVAHAIWNAGHALGDLFGSVIETYIWPTGWFPMGAVGPGIIGYLMKWVCGIYTCKLYDAGTWASIGLQTIEVIDYASRNLGVPVEDAPDADGDGIPDGVDADPNTNYQNAPDADGDGVPDNIDPDTGFDGSGWTPGDEPLSSQPEDPYAWVDLDGNGEISPLENAALGGRDYISSIRSGDTVGSVYGSYQAGGKAYVWSDAANAYAFSMSVEPELWFYNQIREDYDTGDWTINPYKSVKYDALCMPAQLYNLRKEKQLKCIQLKCIRDLAPTGMPITQCEQKYAAQSCLYLESAQARLHPGIGDLMAKFWAVVAIQMAIGFASQCLYRMACKNFFSPLDVGFCIRSPGDCARTPGDLFSWANLELCGGRSVGCGFMKIILSIQEILAFKDNIRSENPSIPQGEDFCAGLTGVEADDTAEEGGIL